MAENKQIIELYTELALNPDKDFGWDKGLNNAQAHGYRQEWIEAIPSPVWQYCAAVGNPFTQADIKKGDTVIDLGCGAGVDLLVSALLVGDQGNVIGVDITPEMVKKATYHANLSGFSNVKVLESSFEHIAVEDESVDVVISNGAINLTSCKESVFAEIYRILKPHGKLFFADMIDTSDEKESCCSIEKSASCGTGDGEDWANCVAGTLRQDALISIMENAGFKDIECTGHTHYTTSETTQGATFKATKIPSDVLRKQHWDTLFRTKDHTQVLWHQETPKTSFMQIEHYANKDDCIIDVGCGASLLVDMLIDDGYKNITLLDTSGTCLDIVKKRLCDKSDIPNYICSDIMHFTAPKKFDLWHDRAVFHFLLLEKEKKRYFEVLQESLIPGGIAIIHTFSVDGEKQCAGLDIVPYNDTRMLQALPSGLSLIAYDEFIHVTPKKSEQKYSSFVIKKI
ncbi:MAG TPA: methyltransferase domain-containing protein [Sulfurovum sp.]|uniref:methyltransferase domain-containing protein n=1 Tax=Sulfurovum sp. TaxID=1969726 RepID=UPI002F941239